MRPPSGIFARVGIRASGFRHVRRRLGEPGLAELVAPGEQDVRLLLLPGDIVGVRAVEGVQALDDRTNVGGHARAAREQAVLLPGAGAAPRGPARRVLVTALR